MLNDAVDALSGRSVPPTPKFFANNQHNVISPSSRPSTTLIVCYIWLAGSSHLSYHLYSPSRHQIFTAIFSLSSPVAVSVHGHCLYSFLFCSIGVCSRGFATSSLFLAFSLSLQSYLNLT